MSQYTCIVAWERADAPFADNRYSRAHRWLFDGGVTVPASASPQVVAAPMSIAAAVDPEEAFVASLSSCHMLWFLSLAARRGLVVDSYRDEAAGTLGAGPGGCRMMTEVILRPEVAFGAGSTPTPAEVDALHNEAHAQCFIANSVRTEVRCEPVLPLAAAGAQAYRSPRATGS